jgi:ABC-type sugar transport system ATPase subunit
MKGLALTDVHKSYGDVSAVCGATFEVPAGHLAVLVGPSACGKTTTLRMIAGLERPDGGEIHLDRRNLKSLLPHQRDLAMVTQTPALYPHMTVQRNLAFPLRLAHMARKQVRERVNHAAMLMSLDDVLHRRPDELSGGQQQRAALGKAVAQSPRLWLFDEPLASLDAPLRRQLGREIVALQKKTGTTTLLVTHDQSEALACGDWLIVMDHGRVEQVGTPAEIYARPANRFVASFLGDPPMNLLSGDVVQGRFRAEGIALELPGKVSNGRVVVGIRPEDVALTGGGPTTELRAAVQRLEFRGHDVLVDVRLGVHSIRIRMRPDASLEVGRLLHFILPQEKLHVFEAGPKGQSVGGTP